MSENNKGVFITLEGPDGSGKTTNFPVLCNMLASAGFDVVMTRQPGGSPTAEVIRKAVLGTPLEEPMDPVSEILLYAASRRQVLKSVIEPALAQGKIVVSDRWADSSYAYQGVARGYMQEYLAVRDVVHKDFWPDFTLYFDIPLKKSLERMASRVKDYNRLNAEDIEFRKRCFKGYDGLVNHSDLAFRWVILDADKPLAMVQNAMQSWVNKFTLDHQHLLRHPLTPIKD